MKNAEREFVNAARCFAKVCDVRWPNNEAAQAALISHLCEWAAGSEGKQAERLVNAEKALHQERAAHV